MAARSLPALTPSQSGYSDDTAPRIRAYLGER
jgi:hypothetical protein